MARLNDSSTQHARTSTSPTNSAQIPSLPPFRKTILAKSTHQQFPDFEVTLLAFETPQAVEEFLDSQDQEVCPGTSPHHWSVVGPGQLVAVCFAGDEAAHPRHVPIIGLIDGSAKKGDGLHRKVEQLIDNKIFRSTSAIQQSSLWQTGEYVVGCTNSTQGDELQGFEQLTFKYADLGEEIIRHHLYRWEKSPHLHASEGRRMAFNERYTYASVSLNHSISDEKWRRESNEDNFIPSLSIEWVDKGYIRGTTTSTLFQRRLYSKTGFCIEVTDTPSIVVLNRCYPHWRAAEISYLQLIPPNILFDRAIVEHRKVNGNLDRNLSIVRHLQHRLGDFEEQRQGFHQHQSLAQAVLSHMADFVLEQKGGACSPAIYSAMTDMAKLSKKIIQTSDICRYGSVLVQPPPGALAQLLFTSFYCLKDTYSLGDTETELFTTAIPRAMKEISNAACIPDDVMECFLVISGLAQADTAPLCGKGIRLAQQSASETIETETDKFEGVIDKTVFSNDGSECTRSQLDRPRDSSQSDSDHEMGALPNTDDDDSVYEDRQDGDYEDVIDRGERSRPHRKRPSDVSLSHLNTKVIRAKMTSNSCTTAAQSRGHSTPGTEGKQVKELIQHVMVGETRDETTETFAYRAGLFKASIEHELAQPKQVPTEVASWCSTFFKITTLSNERCALEQMNSVNKICQLAEKKGNGRDWDWVILTLVHQANETVKRLAGKAEKAYRQYCDKGPSLSLRSELKREKYSLSDPLIELLARINANLEDESTFERQGGKNYTRAVEIGETLIKSLHNVLQSTKDKGEETCHDSVSNTRDCRVSVPIDGNISGRPIATTPVPHVCMTLISFPGKGGTPAKRYRETVFDVLFQVYFTPLVDYLTARDLKGGPLRGCKRWSWHRRLFRFRLELIERLVKNCKIGSALFAAHTCSDLVVAPVCYLPLSKEDAEMSSSRGYTFPRFVLKNGKHVSDLDEQDSLDQEGWKALYCSLRATKDDIIRLAKIKDPTGSITPHIGVS